MFARYKYELRVTMSQLCLSLGRFEISQMSSLSIQVLESKIAAFYTPTTQLRVDVVDR